MKKSSTVKWYGLLVAAIIAVGLGVYLFNSGTHQDEAAMGAGHFPSDSNVVLNSSMRSLDTVTRGAQLTYRIDWRSQLTLGDIPSAEPFVSMDASGLWELKFVDSDDESFLVEALLSGVKFSATGQSESKDWEKEVVDGLSKPIYFRIDRNGQISELHILPQIPVMAQSAQKSLLANYQFVTSHSEENTAWITKEKDTTGLFVAEYQQEADSNQYLKKKLRYETVSSSGLGKKFQADIVTSESLFTLVAELTDDSAGGIIKEIDSNEIISLAQSDFLPETRNESEFHLTLVKASIADKVDAANLVDYMKTSLDGPSSKMAVDHQMDMVKIAGLSFSDMWNSLLELDEGDVKQRGKIFQRMGALFRHDASAISEALALIQQDDERAGFLIDTLAFAGNKESQNALLKMFDEGVLDEKYQMRALRGLSRTTTPEKENFDFHLKLLDEDGYQEQALYGLGTMSGTPAGSNSEYREIVGDVLRDTLTSSSSSDDRIVALRAMGNSGDSTYKEDIVSLLEDPNENIRSESVKALGSLSGTDVVDAITQRAINDDDFGVRSSAIASLGNHLSSDSAVEALAKVCQTEQVPQLRKQATSSIARRRDSAIVESLFRWMAEHEPVAEIRMLAQQAL